MENENPDDGLTPEALAYIRWQEENPNVWGDHDENGVDLARLRENLKLTPAERLRRMEKGRNFPIVGALLKANVRFVVIGDVAARFYAAFDASLTVDVMYADEHQNIE